MEKYPQHLQFPKFEVIIMLQHLYGKDTRSVRVLNLGINVIWAYLIITHLAGIAEVNLPEKIEPKFTHILYLVLTTIIITLLSFVQCCHKDRFKFASLILGSIVQILIGLKYVTNYPPFDMMVIVCGSLALWFVLGAFYVKSLHESSRRTPNADGIT